jgi:hypothetical protein
MFGLLNHRAVAVSFLAATWLLTTAQAPDSGDAFYEIVESAATESQLAALTGPLGSVGVLADGTSPESYVLPSGPTVPAAMGTQPLEYKPLASLGMPDNPGLLDELASGGVHTDGYNSSTSPLPGPRGINPLVRHIEVHDEDTRACTPLLLDPEGYLASLCVSPLAQGELVLFDPNDDFKILARTLLPPRPHPLDPAGGWYTRMDNLGRPLVPTATQELRAYRAVQTEGVFEWTIDEQWSFADILPEGMSASDVIPSFDGGYWFISGFAHIGHLDPDTGEGTAVWLNTDANIASGIYELAGVALTVGPEGAYFLTNAAIYMFDLDEQGVPRQRWRWEYDELARGIDLSTPTLHDEGRLVTFSINDVDKGTTELVVLRTDAEPMDFEERLVCRMNMFKDGEAAIKNTTMGYRRTIVAENNYGGDFYEVGDFPPGIARVDVRDDYSGCDLIWENYEVSSQVPPRLSTGDGHIWLYSHRMGMGEDVHAYYLSALDFETGAIESEVFIGSGQRIDNPMLSVDFLKGGVLMTGVRNGIITMCDSLPDADGTPTCMDSDEICAEDPAACVAERVSGSAGGCAVAQGRGAPVGVALIMVFFVAIRLGRPRFE